MRKYIHNWQLLPTWEVPKYFNPKTNISIIAPARNEADAIEACLQSILTQNYPANSYEILIVDDHSTDATPQIVLQLAKQFPQIKLIALADFVDEKNSKSFKKKAIETALKQAKGELIVTTDADCIVPPNWLALIASYYETKNPKFIAAPVNFYQEKSALERFQSLDFIGMMGVTGAGIQGNFMNMCNGANLAYPKSAFYAVNGFEGIDHVASGDDMLLMQKIAAKFPDQIGYIKNPAACVLTHAKPTWKTFLNQRIRWASKSGSYKEWRVTLILAMVFFFCCNIVFSLCLIPYFGWIGCAIFIGQLLVKALMDFLFLSKMSAFFNRQDLMTTFWTSFFLHIAYIVLVGFLANIIKEYQWKGRKTH